MNFVETSENTCDVSRTYMDLWFCTSLHIVWQYWDLNIGTFISMRPSIYYYVFFISLKLFGCILFVWFSSLQYAPGCMAPCGIHDIPSISPRAVSFGCLINQSRLCRVKEEGKGDIGIQFHATCVPDLGYKAEYATMQMMFSPTHYSKHRTTEWDLE